MKLKLIIFAILISITSILTAQSNVWDDSTVKTTTLGKIGLGTSSPDALLTLYKTSNTVRAVADISFKTNNIIQDPAAVAAISGKIYTTYENDYSSGNRMSFQTNKSGYLIDVMTLCWGKVGIGTIAPNGKFEIVQTDYSQGTNDALKITTDSGGGLGIYASSNTTNPVWRLDTFSNEDFTIRAGSVERLFIEGNTGYIGIGTASPDERLEVQNGNVLIQRTDDTISALILERSIDQEWRLENRAGAEAGWFVLRRTGGILPFRINPNAAQNLMVLKDSGIGIGTDNPEVNRLHLYNKSIKIQSSYSSTVNVELTNLDATWIVQNRNATGSVYDDAFTIARNNSSGVNILPVRITKEAKQNSLTITQNGVGINTETPDSDAELTVAGKISARDITIKSNAGTGADFVFEKDYALPSLEQVEQYVQENKHLPGIPSAQEMQENGVQVSEMQTKLLQKIEELTLYVIDLKKENQEMKNEIKQLKIVNYKAN